MFDECIIKPGVSNELDDLLKENYYIDNECPYGDGKSSIKIKNILNERF